MRKGHGAGWLRRSRLLFIWPILSLLVLPIPTLAAQPKAHKSSAPESSTETASASDAESKPTAPAPAAAPIAPVPAAIPVHEVAPQAAQAVSVLRGLTDAIASGPEVDAITARLPALREQIDAEIVDVKRILREQPTLGVLQAQQEIWQQRHFEAMAWLNGLTRRATTVYEDVSRLTELSKTWTLTREAARAERAPPPILLQIDSLLAEIDVVKARLEAERDAVLDLQSAVAQQVARSGGTLAQLAQAQQRAVGGILRRDGPRVWDAESWTQARAVWRAHVGRVASTYRSAIERYVRDSSQGIGRHLGSLAALAVLLVLVRRRVRQWTATAEDVSPAMRVFERPYSATAVFALMIASSPWSPVPVPLHGLIVVMGVGPVIRLVLPAAGPGVTLELLALWGLFVTDSVRSACAGITLFEQALLAVEVTAGIALLRHSLKSGRLRLLSARRSETERLANRRTAAGLIMVALVVALVTGWLGYLRLARLLASGLLSGAVLALMLYAGVLVVAGLVAFALRVWPLSLLQMVQHHHDMIERRARRVLGLMAVAGWAARMLDYVGLFRPTLSLVQHALTAPLARGSIRISAGDILEFVVTVWVAYLISAFIRFVLSEDVYPRTQIPRGISYAISSLLNYVIIALGFVLALGIAGMDLNKVTVLAGALGVGIGFGLQSVVNNFVSGLILLFERPIHVGDVVDVGDLSGEVSRIGIRASRVRTWQGAEIIVPNAQLITERVTNWTLSDRTRRIDLPVGVDYGSAPEKVIEVLVGVAREHPQVMKAPAPSAVFMAFGDSSINFELRCWTSRFDRWKAIETELASGVYAALRGAGMTFPLPQREVRLLPDGGARAADTPSPRPSD